METDDLHPSNRFLVQHGTVAGGVGTATDIDPTAGPKPGQRELQCAGVTMAEAWRNRQHSSAASRICRVTRASGGKDRHSKVLTSKGLRDRRVRLSVPTAIQFYDLQDRLGYDQPSKAVEWLIKAAAAAIADLPSLDAAFPNGGKPPPETEDAEKPRQHEQHLTKSACSSTSETSKGSVLSLARSEIRVKARERARERMATAKDKDKDKDKDGDDDDDQFASVAHQQTLNLHPSSSHSSFIELLTGGNHQNHNHNHAAAIKTGLFGQVGLFSDGGKPHHPPGFPTETHFNIAAAALATGDHPEMQQQQQQQFAFTPEHLIPLAATATGGDYINFLISSSGVAGFNRGTLQSNIASLQPNHHHHLQRLTSSLDGSNLPFFLGPASQPASASWEGTLPGGFDGRLHLCYDGHRHSDLKGKGGN